MFPLFIDWDTFKCLVEPVQVQFPVVVITATEAQYNRLCLGQGLLSQLHPVLLNKTLIRYTNRQDVKTGCTNQVIQDILTTSCVKIFKWALEMQTINYKLILMLILVLQTKPLIHDSDVPDNSSFSKAAKVTFDDSESDTPPPLPVSSNPALLEAINDDFKPVR